MEENRKRNKKFGRIVYSKSYYKNRIPNNYIPYKNNINNINNYDETTKRYDNIIKKARKTIEDYKKQLNDEDYFNNDIFYDNHIKTQLNKFNQGETDYRYFSPYLSQKGNWNNQITKINGNNKAGRCLSEHKLDNKNSNKEPGINNKQNFKKYFDELYNESSKNSNNINNNINLSEKNEINKLKKKNIENEKIILENIKEKEKLIQKIKELEKTIKSYQNKLNKNNNIVVINKKEKDEAKGKS